jgi:hypothetical protein
MLLDEGGTSPPEVLLQSLNMLTQTHGRERSLSQFKALLESVGFRNIQGKKTGACFEQQPIPIYTTHWAEFARVPVFRPACTAAPQLH